MIVSLRRTGLADSTVRSIYTVLRAGLDGAVRDGLIGKNVAASVRRPRVERNEAHALGPQDVSKLLNAARPRRYYIGVLAMATLGLRRGEVAALRWADVNLDKHELTVSHTLARVDGELILSMPRRSVLAGVCPFRPPSSPSSKR